MRSLLAIKLLKDLIKYRIPVRRLSEKVNDSVVSSEWPKRIFSGIQPTGAIHIGNYFGAVTNWVALQNKGEDVIVSIADLHSITIPQDPKVLNRNILELTAYLIAAGIDPDKTTLFLQSTVPQHAELCWILSCHATMARLGHLPQYKEKSAQFKEIPLGLFVYPVLQAADILLYKATHVPVGEDQVQQLQMAQQLVKTFNHRFGKTFPSPMPLLPDDGGLRIRSLRDPSKKMSKSDTDPKSRILLSDTPDEITKKLKKAVTDFTPEVTYDMDNRPGVSNMINIHSLVTDKIPEEIVEESFAINTGRYKYVVAEALIAHLEPIRQKALDLLARPEQLLEVLKEGARKAESRAKEVHSEVVNKIGIGFPALDIRRMVSKSN